MERATKRLPGVNKSHRLWHAPYLNRSSRSRPALGVATVALLPTMRTWAAGSLLALPPPPSPSDWALWSLILPWARKRSACREEYNVESAL